MDQRVYAVMQMLREQELPPPSNLQAITYKPTGQKKQKKSFEKMAQKVELSETRLRALFKSNVGLSPTQFVKKLKMDEAAKMLRDTYLKVIEIRARFGAKDGSRFVRDFKKAHGMTPTQYRKLHQRRSGGESGTENGASS